MATAWSAVASLAAVVLSAVFEKVAAAYAYGGIAVLIAGSATFAARAA